MLPVPAAATGTIANDDTDVTVAVSPSSVTEDGAANLVYTFTRNGVTAGSLTVNFTVAGTAAFATDYTQTGAATFAAASGTVTFGAGNSTAAITVDPSADSHSRIRRDGNPDSDCRHWLQCCQSRPPQPELSPTTDTDVTVAVSPSSVTEDGAANLVYTFTRNGVTAGSLTVNFLCRRYRRLRHGLHTNRRDYFRRCQWHGYLWRRELDRRGNR